MSIRVDARLQWARFSRLCAGRGPVASAAPWFGTLIGSLLLSVSHGNLWLIGIGILIAVLGVLPEIAGGYWRSYEEDDFDLQQARERLLLQWTIGAHREISDRMTRGRPLSDVDLDGIAKRALEFLKVDVYGDIPDLRTVLYLTDEAGTSLIPNWQAGREDNARPFIAGTPRGDSALNASMRSGYIYSDDITKRPNRWGGTGNGYKTFVSVPLVVDGIGFGMLTVDAPEVGALSEEDGPLLEAVSSVFERVLAELHGAKRNVPGDPPSKINPIAKMVKCVMKGR